MVAQTSQTYPNIKCYHNKGVSNGTWCAYHMTPNTTATPVNTKGTIADREAMLKAPLQAVVVGVPVALTTCVLPAQCSTGLLQETSG